MEFNYQSSIVNRSFLDRCLIDKHHRDLIADRVNQSAFFVYALEFGLFLVDLDL